MKKFIAAALAGAIAREAARRAWQEHRSQSRPRRRPGYPPRTWREARERMAQQVGAAAKREGLALLARAGVPVPRQRPRTLFGPQAVALILPRKHDQWDEKG